MPLSNVLNKFMEFVTLTEEQIVEAEHDLILIEVAYATPDKQVIKQLEVESSIKPRDAIKRSNLKDDFPEINYESAKIGVFGKIIKDDYKLYMHDRIEIYRPLLADPKEVRRRLAAEGKTMGKKKET